MMKNRTWLAYRDAGRSRKPFFGDRDIMDERTISNVAKDAQQLAATASCDVGSAVVASAIHHAIGQGVGVLMGKAEKSLPESQQPENSGT
jgi:hypothetical protein